MTSLGQVEMREAELILENDIYCEQQAIGMTVELLLASKANSLTSRACDSC